MAGAYCYAQEATREHDKSMRQMRAKLQRTEAELRSAKQQATQQAARVQELEAANAKKYLQLDTAVQQARGQHIGSACCLLCCLHCCV